MNLCAINDIDEEEAKSFRLESGTQIFAVKKDGVLTIYENRCPHLGIPLEMMPDQFLDVEKCFIQCSTHGALFEIDTGLCVSGPCNGERLKSIPFELDGEQVHIKQS